MQRFPVNPSKKPFAAAIIPIFIVIFKSPQSPDAGAPKV